jgi:hypothetical protein
MAHVITIEDMMGFADMTGVADTTTGIADLDGLPEADRDGLSDDDWDGLSDDDRDDFSDADRDGLSDDDRDGFSDDNLDGIPEDKQHGGTLSPCSRDASSHPTDTLPFRYKRRAALKCRKLISMTTSTAIDPHGAEEGQSCSADGQSCSADGQSCSGDGQSCYEDEQLCGEKDRVDSSDEDSWSAEESRAAYFKNAIRTKRRKTYPMYHATDQLERRKPTHWPPEVLNLTTVALNRYIASRRLDARQISQLKRERRRMLNRMYARASRDAKAKRG